MARSRPILLFDGDCAFCSSCARFIERRIPTGAEVVAWQLTDLAPLGLTPAEAAAALRWVDADGTVSTGAAAVAKLLVDAGSWWAVPGRFLALPGVRWAAEPLYRLLARNRHRMPGGTAACALPAAGGDRPRRTDRADPGASARSVS